MRRGTHDRSAKLDPSFSYPSSFDLSVVVRDWPTWDNCLTMGIRSLQEAIHGVLSGCTDIP